MWWYFWFRYHMGCIPCKNLHTWVNCHYSMNNMVKNSIQPKWYTNQVYKDSLTMTYPPHLSQYLIGVTILIPMGRFFNTIIDVGYWRHAFTCVPKQYYFLPLHLSTLGWLSILLRFWNSSRVDRNECWSGVIFYYTIWVSNNEFMGMFFW